jgi:hypothetical protein
MKEITDILGAWSDEANGWVSETLELTGDAWLEVTLPEKGRIVIKKAENISGPYPKALITKWDGPDFRIRLYGSTEKRYIKVITTDTPTKIQIANV